MSFVEVPEEHDFSYHNLPYGIFSTLNNQRRRPGVAIGDYVLDLLAVKHYFTGPLMKEIAADVFSQSTLNDFMALTPEHWHETREYLKALLSKDTPFLRDDKSLRNQALHPMKDVEMHLPAKIGDYTDFYVSIYHAKNIGLMMRGPGNELMPNYRHLPVAYHGRASSVIVSGTPVARPSGQMCPPNSEQPVFGPSRALDFELEMGIFIGGKTNMVGQPIRMSDAEKNLFGLVLMNDWSARDVQRWEYQPLGPFLSKNFATTISPWIVTFEALASFKTENYKQDFQPLPYLRHDDKFNFDINLEVLYKPSQLTESKVISRSNYKYLYWSAKQMLAHHTVTGCNLNPGDMFGTGTISGPDEGSYGSMMELAWRGTKPIKFDESITRTYIEDGDEVILRGFCQGDNYRVGFGECSGLVLPTQRIQREFKEVIADEALRTQYYIEACESNVLQLKGYVNGPPDTPYEGGRFHLEMNIPETYPFCPPKCKFITRIWHPNISSATGAICLDILKDQWAAAMTIRTVLLSLQTLLAVPEANDPQDAVVARQHIDNIELFRQTARYWTYIFALPSTSVDTKLRFKITPTLSKFPTASPNMPFAKFIEFNMKVRKLVEIMHTDELTALHELSSHDWDLDRATQSLIS